MKKKIYLGFLILCALLCMTQFALADPTIAVVNNPNPTDRLHLRKEMNEESISYGKYYNGVEVTVIRNHGEWSNVDVYDQKGYMKSEYLAFGGAAANVKSAVPTALVNNPSGGGWVNLRRYASMDASSLGRYGDGTSIEVLGVGHVWNHVRYEGVTGFMMAQYLKGDIAYEKDGASGSGTSIATVVNPTVGTRLNLRKTPSESAESIGKFYTGTQVNVIEKRRDGWCYVTIGGELCMATGYMRTAFLNFSSKSNAKSEIRTVTTKTEAALEFTPGGADDGIWGFSVGSQFAILGDVGDDYHFVQAIRTDLGIITGYLHSRNL